MVAWTADWYRDVYARFFADIARAAPTVWQDDLVQVIHLSVWHAPDVHGSREPRFPRLAPQTGAIVTCRST